MPDSLHRLGPIALAPDISRGNAATFLVGAFITVTLTTFISVIQPYVLTVNIGLPVEQQGQVSGDMVFYGEIVLLTLSAAIGALSDRFGRRGMYVTGALILALGFVLYGYVDSVASLTATRIFLAFGIATVNIMLQGVQADYPDEQSRGKLVGFTGIAIGIGQVLIGVVFLRLPDWYVEAGNSELSASRYTMLTMTGIALLLAGLLQLGLKGGRAASAPKQSVSFLDSMAQGIRAGRENLNIALSYGCAFVARADLVVVGTFYTLWLNQAGVEAGMTPDDAAKNAGAFFALAMTSALIWAPIFGVLNDRMNRTYAMALAMLLCTIGYSAMGLIPDPLGGWMYPAAVMLGVGQMSAVSASQTLVGQEASVEHRGSIIGMFSFFGAAGIMFITSVGGRIYDAFDPSAPFVMVGSINALLLICALIVGHRTRRLATA